MQQQHVNTWPHCGLISPFSRTRVNICITYISRNYSPSAICLPLVAWVCQYLFLRNCFQKPRKVLQSYVCKNRIKPEITITSNDHSRSRVLGSVESGEGLLCRCIIMLVISLKFLKTQVAKALKVAFFNNSTVIWRHLSKEPWQIYA